jgi:hypothetical protein
MVAVASGCEGSVVSLMLLLLQLLPLMMPRPPLLLPKLSCAVETGRRAEA